MLKKYLIYASIIIGRLHCVEPNTIIGIVQDLPVPTFSVPYAVAFIPDHEIAYVVNMYANSVSIIDVTTNKVTGTVVDLDPATFDSPIVIAVTPNGQKAYVANTGNDSISVIDVVTSSVTNSVTGSFYTPVAIAFTPDGATAYIVNLNGSNISIIDVATDTQIGTVSGSFDSPGGIALAGNRGYVINQGNNTVSVFDLDTNTVTDTISDASFDFIFAIAAAPNGSTVYATNFTGNSVSVIDVTSNTVTTTIGPITYPKTIVITPNSSTAYVATVDDQVIVCDLNHNTISGLVSDPYATFSSPYGMAITPDGSLGYITNYTGNTVSIMFITLAAPSCVQGCKTCNTFLLETDLINRIRWTFPAHGLMPSGYSIYRDAELTDFVATVSADDVLQYYDHNREPGVTYWYYVVSVDQNGTLSPANSVTVIKPC